MLLLAALLVDGDTVDPPTRSDDAEGSRMSVVEVLQFAVAVQLAAGVVTMVNVVLSRLRGRS